MRGISRDRRDRRRLTRGLGWALALLVGLGLGGLMPGQAQATATYDAFVKLDFAITSLPTAVSMGAWAGSILTDFVLNPASGDGLTHTQSATAVQVPPASVQAAAGGSVNGALGGIHVDSFGNAKTGTTFTNNSDTLPQEVAYTLTLSWAISGSVDNQTAEFALASVFATLTLNGQESVLLDEIDFAGGGLGAAFADGADNIVIQGQFTLDPEEIATLSLLVDAFGSADFVPAPAAAVLLVAGLATAAGVARRRRPR